MDIRRRMFFRKKESSSGGSTTDGSYTVNLNGQWEKTTAVPNPDSTLYDGVYRSSSNYNVNNGVATMYITIKDCSSFKMYIRSYAESAYDYVMVSQLDQTITGSTSYSNTTLVKAYTRTNQQSGTALYNYTLVEFTGISLGEHTITVVYRKDATGHVGDDRGYVLISKSNEGSGGDIEIDTTYAIYYTSSDGNVVTPNKTNVFGANIVSNNYVNGQGIISFDGPITNIGDYAFRNCSNLTSVTIPDSVTSIGGQAFLECSNLKSVTIPNSVTSIREYAFRSSSLISVTISDSVTSIGRAAFYDCTSLTNVTIGNGVASIGQDAFRNCSSLTSVTIPDSVTSIGNEAFNYCRSLTSVTIGDSVTTIGKDAFQGCKSLIEFKGKFATEDGRSLIMDNTIIAYAKASGTTYTIPDGVTTIGEGAFADCYSLTSVTIPDSVTSIGERAFYNSYNLTSVYCKATTPPALGDTTVFYSSGSGRKIYVPTGSVNAYKSAKGWSEYADAIVGYNF